MSQELSLVVSTQVAYALAPANGAHRSVNAVLEPLLTYEKLIGASPGGRDRRDAYARTLDVRPWKTCPCEVCQTIGVEVIIFRGSVRNKRRGFHNLFVLYQRLHKELSNMAATRKGRKRAPAVL